jgi:hypothetical protein
MVWRRICCGAQTPTDEGDPMTEVLRKDARTAWAYRRYMEQRTPWGISEDTGRWILSVLEPGDHVELFADAVIPEKQGWIAAMKLARTDRFPALAARTLRCWILVNLETGQLSVIPCAVDDGPGFYTGPGTKWPDIGWGTTVPTTGGGEISFMVFLDAPECVERDVIDKGAGRHIMRLPESPDVPPMPDLESLPSKSPAPTPAFLPTDWRTTEELACAHLRSLGFADARLTAGGRDGGVDAVAQDAVAQVKMQALPVGAPQVQQLRGTRPHLRHHIFYSSSGYTPAALTAATETGVHLFKIEPNGSVHPVNAPAVALTRAGVHTDQPRTASVEQVVEEYVSGARERLTQAFRVADVAGAISREKYSGQYIRMFGYLLKAMANDATGKSSASAREAAVFYHHTELLAHVWFQEFGVPYPAGEGEITPAETLDDYYG